MARALERAAAPVFKKTGEPVMCTAWQRGFHVLSEQRTVHG
jgi:hypothetical protein